MVNAQTAFNMTQSLGIDTYIGVPDSLLKGFISMVDKTNFTHKIVSNEAHAVGIAFGLMLGGKNPCVYLQNSGIGNIINPLTSLCIPANMCPLIVIGHRHTLPQHKIMGEVDNKLIDIIGYSDYIMVTGGNNVK